ncbi:MAG TPA: MaoC family dehydratase, partial [Albitalea sp.]|nr:MaoC family dehydratase [Albitalea sp.]
DGGFGGASGPVKPVHELPARAPEHTMDFATQPRAALVYRLSGDYNPLHAEPAIGRAAGFERPILHGLASYGIAGWAVIKSVCDGDPNGIAGVDVRFSSPVYPGETIRTEMWVDGKTVSFRARVLERDVVVINNGRAMLR